MIGNWMSAREERTEPADTHCIPEPESSLEFICWCLDCNKGVLKNADCIFLRCFGFLCLGILLCQCDSFIKSYSGVDVDLDEDPESGVNFILERKA